MDVVLVALFAPDYNAVFDKLMLHAPAAVLAQADGAESTWERATSAEWREAVREELGKLVSYLRSGACHRMTVAPMRCLFASVPTTEMNFGGSEEQSAVDFLRYLFAIFRVRDSLVGFQQSLTYFKPRPAVKEAGGDISKLVHEWLKWPIVNKWTYANAGTCTDADVRADLMRDVTGQAMVLVNQAGDMRRISQVEHASVFLCQLTPEDEAAASVRIDRDMLPSVQLLGENAEGYSGPYATKMVACRLLHVPVLLFEVSRKVFQVQGGSFVEKKLQTRIAYGNDAGELQLSGNVFYLVAVICHVGHASSGHYIAYVRVNDQWLLYDDAAPNGELLPVASIEPAASMHGELYFYTC